MAEAAPNSAKVESVSVTILTVTDATHANPILIKTSTQHGFVTGHCVRIEGVVGNTNANGDWLVTVGSEPSSKVEFSGNGAMVGTAHASSATLLSWNRGSKHAHIMD